jgi:hypothetical protein
MDEVHGQPWTRKHDHPEVPTVPAAPTTKFPKTLEDLIEFCATHTRRATAAGSHWSLSRAAVADSVFIETHVPNESHQAMGRTLFEVVPGCLSAKCIGVLQVRTVTFDPTSAIENLGEYLVAFETGKRIYQLYAELDTGDDNNPESLAVLLRDKHQNSSYLGPWAIETLGGAGGQTVFGAATTGTHGGDFRFPPLADSIVALHLVTDGGKHYWIEPPDPSLGVITDDNKLRERYGADKYRGNEAAGSGKNFEIIRDARVFNAVLIGAWRFGIVYSVVVRARRRYSLHEERRLTTWQAIKSQVSNPASSLFVGSTPSLPLRNRFLQIAVSVTPHANFTRNLAGVTRRWNVPIAFNPISLQPAGWAERVGTILLPFDANIQAPRFTRAGNSHPYAPGDQPGTAADPSFLEQACAHANFLQGVVQEAIDEITTFIESNGAEIGGGLAAVAAAGGGGLLPLLAALAAILAILAAFLDWLASQSDPRFGQTMEHLRDELLSDPETRAAGLLVWQMIVFEVFSQQQADRDYEALGYAVMDGHDYLDKSCSVNVDSIEVFFAATDTMAIAFVDALLAFEVTQEGQGRAFVGYISLRFTGPTRALIGEETAAPTCVIEVAGLKDVTGVTELIDFALTLALNPNVNGILHWGQRNTANRAQIEARFGDTAANPTGRLHGWRSALGALTKHGRLNGFSNAFTRATGLEVVEPQIASLKVVGSVPPPGQLLTIGWDCANNPPGTNLHLKVTGPSGSNSFTGLALSAQQAVPTTVAGPYTATLTAGLDLAGLHREVKKSLTVAIA